MASAFLVHLSQERKFAERKSTQRERLECTLEKTIAPVETRKDGNVDRSAELNSTTEAKVIATFDIYNDRIADCNACDGPEGL